MRLGALCTVLATAAAFAPSAAGADPTAATLGDRLMHTIYPDKGVPTGYDAPVSLDLGGENPRQVRFNFARTADGNVTRLRYDLYDDAATLAKHYPYAKPKGEVELNPVLYRFGSYHASCSSYYDRAKRQVSDICDSVIGATVMDISTTYDVPAGTALSPNATPGAFLTSIRNASTVFVTDGATFLVNVGGLSQ